MYKLLHVINASQESSRGFKLELGDQLRCLDFGILGLLGANPSPVKVSLLIL